MDKRDKQAAVFALQETLALANELKKLDRAVYGQVFAWINRSMHSKTPLKKIARVIEIARANADYGQRPRELHQYLNGIARSLDGEQAAAELRAGQKNSISDILGRAMAAAMEEKTNGKR